MIDRCIVSSILRFITVYLFDMQNIKVICCCTFIILFTVNYKPNLGTISLKSRLLIPHIVNDELRWIVCCVKFMANEAASRTE